MQKQKHKEHYRVLRSTIVLARSSAALGEIITPELEAALRRAEHVNYDFEQVPAAELEMLYAQFDDAFTARVRGEYEFKSGAESVVVHKECIATCRLCGKGDSKETGDNRDHIRFEFKLTNTAGGRDVWCGSTCIVHFGLNVQGAATSDEARKILEQNMRRALRQFEIERWRGEHPDHAEIPGEYQALRRAMQALPRTWDLFVPMLLGGHGIASELEREWYEASRLFRAASRFYGREHFLTPIKQAAWERARIVSARIDRVRAMIRGAQQCRTTDEVFEYYRKHGDKNENAA